MDQITILPIIGFKLINFLSRLVVKYHLKNVNTLNYFVKIIQKIFKNVPVNSYSFNFKNPKNAINF